MYYCAEDSLSRAVARKLIEFVFGKLSLTEMGGDQGGNSTIRTKFAKYAILAAHHPVLIITDLDTEVCPPLLRSKWLLQSHRVDPLPENFIFCVAVREVESWLLSDRGSISTFFGVSMALVPEDPESLVDPKKSVVDIARQSRISHIKADIPPAHGSSSKVGLGYNSQLSKFVVEAWRPNVGRDHCLSLSRAIVRLEQVRQRLA